MDDKIPQSFKVQWLNSTLKFVKNDNQMFQECPQMPIAQVEYLYNLMWHRQNNVGLGFKSLYAPLWEAMSIYSVKYQFEVSVTKAASGEFGQLKIQKITKNTSEDCNKPPIEPNIPEMQNSATSVYEEPLIQQKINSTNQECAKVLESNDYDKVKMKPKKPSKSHKYFVHIRKIIDSIAPAFFKMSFQKIYNFINDEASASFTFSDLAPNEAKFLENFLGIYNRRMCFGVFFSPYCNDLLDKMCISFKEFDKTAKLEIFVGKTDAKTCKREIIFLKVPRYTKKTSSKAKISKNTSSQLNSENETDSSSCKFLKALKKTDFSSNDDHDTSNFISDSDSRAIDKTDVETDDVFEFNATGKATVKSIVINNVDLKDVQNTTSVQATEVFECEPISTYHIDLHNENELENKRKLSKTTDLTSNNETYKTNNVFAKVIEKTEIIEDKDKVLPESKEEEKIVDNSNINNVSKNIKETKTLVTINNKKETDMTEDLKEKMRSLYLKDTKKTPQIPKTSNPFAKASNSTDNEKGVSKSVDVKVTQGSREHRLIEAMSTPLESDKALRMMRLMGWEGGALGLRGEGIIEPIIPVLNIKPGAGLGHVSEKSKNKQDKLHNRLQLLEAILDLITKDITESIILCNCDVTKKEKRCFNEIIHLVNMNRPLNLANKYENDLCQKIHENMADAQFKLELVYDSTRKIILNKILNTEIKGKKSKNKKKMTTQITLSDFKPESANILEMPTKQMEFKELILTKVLEFQKDKQCLVLNVHFDSILTTRHKKILEKLCSRVNSRLMMTKKHVPFNLASELYQNLDDTFFDITFGLDLQSFTICKVKENPGTNEVIKKKNDKTVTVDEINNTVSEISLMDGDQRALSENESDNATNEKETAQNNTDKKDSKNVNDMDSNNNCGLKEVDLNTIWSGVPSNSLSPKQSDPYILLVQTKTKKCAKHITKLILKKIDSEIEFTPYLKNHGVQDGYIVYSCYKKNSYLWLKNLLTDYRVIDYRGIDEVYVLKLEINAIIDCDKILSLLEIYNPGLNSSDWDVLDAKYLNNCIEFLVQLDLDSFKYVQNNNFRLAAGIDDVKFSLNIEYYCSYLSSV